MNARVGFESEDQMESKGGIILLSVHTPVVCRKYALSDVDVHSGQLPWSFCTIPTSDASVRFSAYVRSCGAIPPPKTEEECP